MRLKVINQAKNLAGKRVVMRVDFNTPLIKGKVLDNSRLVAVIPTLRLLEKAGSKQVMLVSHLGRPNGKIVQSLSLRPIARELSRLLKRKVKLISLSHAFQTKAANEPLVLLENIRFLPGEEKNDKKLAQQLASLGDIFINDAFSVSHHPSASLVGITRYLPSYAGLSFAHEVQELNRVAGQSAKPLVAIIGGAKVADKLPVIEKILSRVDYILVGGVVANTFLKAKGHKIGKSLFDKSLVAQARAVLKKCKRKIILPSDVIVDLTSTKKKEHTLVSINKVSSQHRIMDLGTETIQQYSAVVKKAKTVIWAGTLGKTEELVYAHGSRSLGRLVSARARRSTFVVVGGGDTVGFFHQNRLWVDHFSLAGGASLKFLAGEKLPALVPLLTSTTRTLSILTYQLL
ncbi:MAG: phosphoglycerate kinase [Patescibacteria group bacterium]